MLYFWRATNPIAFEYANDFWNVPAVNHDFYSKASDCRIYLEQPQLIITNGHPITAVFCEAITVSVLNIISLN